MVAGYTPTTDDFYVSAVYASDDVRWLVPDEDYQLADENLSITVGDNSYTINIWGQYSVEYDFHVRGSLVALSAVYEGDAAAGYSPVITNFTVNGTYEDGSHEVISGAELESTSALVAEQPSDYQISYDGLTCTVSVQCSTTQAEVEDE